MKKPKKPAPKKHKPAKNDPHVPTPETRAAVQAMAASGETHKQIADYLTHFMKVGCGSDNTLRKHYAQELNLGKTHQKLMVSQGLFRKAVGAPAVFDAKGNKVRDEVKPEVTAQIFWLKCQANWVEPSRYTNTSDEKGLSLEDLVHLSYKAGQKAKPD